MEDQQPVHCPACQRILGIVRGDRFWFRHSFGRGPSKLVEGTAVLPMPEYRCRQCGVLYSIRQELGQVRVQPILQVALDSAKP